MTWLQRYRLRHLLRFAFWSVPVGWMMAALIVVRAAIMRMEASGHMSADLPIDLRANCAFGDSQVEVGLQSEPEFGRDTKVFAQSERSVCGDSTLPIDDIADAPGWDSDIPGEPINADAHRLHEFFQKDLPGMNRLEPFLARHISSLRIIEGRSITRHGIVQAVLRRDEGRGRERVEGRGSRDET